MWCECWACSKCLGDGAMDCRGCGSALCLRCIAHGHVCGSYEPPSVSPSLVPAPRPRATRRIPEARIRRALRREARRWKAAQPPPEPTHFYTCPRCHAKAAESIGSFGDDVRMKCRSCGAESSAYEAPMDEWEVITFG